MNMDNNMNITSAHYLVMDGVNTAVRIVVEGKLIDVPLSLSNRHYAEILRQVEAGTLVIQEAE